MLRMRRLLGTVVSFMREGLGSWDEKQIGQKAVEASAWDLCATNELNPDGRRVIGIRFTPDGSTIAVAGALKPDVEGEPFVVEPIEQRDRKSTRLNSSHVAISYAVFCLKKKNEYSHSA